MIPSTCATKTVFHVSFRFIQDPAGPGTGVMRMKALLVVSAVLCLAALTVARPLDEEQDENCLQRNLLEIIMTEIQLEASETRARDAEMDHQGVINHDNNFVNFPPYCSWFPIYEPFNSACRGFFLQQLGLFPTFIIMKSHNYCTLQFAYYVVPSLASWSILSNGVYV